MADTGVPSTRGNLPRCGNILARSGMGHSPLYGAYAVGLQVHLPIQRMRVFGACGTNAAHWGYT